MNGTAGSPQLGKRRPGRPRKDGLEPGSIPKRYCDFEQYTETDPETGRERKGSANWSLYKCGKPLDYRATGSRCIRHAKTRETSNFRGDRGERSIKAYHEVTSWRGQQARILSDFAWKQRASQEALGVLLQDLTGTLGAISGLPDEVARLLTEVTKESGELQERVGVAVSLASALDEQILQALVREFGRGQRAHDLMEDILDSQFGTDRYTRDGRWIDRRLSLLEETVDVALGIRSAADRGEVWQQKFLDDGRKLVARLCDDRLDTVPNRAGLQWKADNFQRQRGADWKLVYARLDAVLACIATRKPFDLGDRPLDP